MQRRDFLRTAGLGAAALATSLPAFGKKNKPAFQPQDIPAPKITSEDHPNILWLVSEDNDCFLGCYGDKLARTPTLDKLASEGVLFERCYGWPVCAPSRFTLISGMYAVGHGPAHHMRAQGKIPAWLKGFPTYLRMAGYYTSNNAKTDYNSPISIPEAWNECGKQGHWRKRPEPKQPFFSVFNHEVTHESCLFPEKELRLDFPATDPAQVRIPPYQPDTPEMRADWVRYYNHMKVLDEQIAAKLKALEEDGLAENTIVFYYSDNGGVLPRSKRCLQESGVHVPLIVRFPPKWQHLAPAAPGSRIKDPVSFIDFAPTVLSLAGVKIPDYMQGHAFLGPAKSAPNAPVFITRDRMDELYDMMRMVSDGQFIYIRNFRPDIPYVQPLEYQFQARGYQSWARVAREGKLTPATAMFWGQKPSEELYEMASDPDSVKNLAGDPAHKATLEKMRAALRQRCIDLKDNGFLPEGSELEGYDASHAPGAWPVERVVDFAILASERDAGNLPKLIAAFDDPSEPIRWWAAQGCAMLREKATPAAATLEKRLTDPSPAVQIAAAESLAYIGKADLAQPVLERWLVGETTVAAALHAANVVSRIEDRAKPLLPAIKQAVHKLAAHEKGMVAGHPNPNRALRRIVAELEGKTERLVYPDATKLTTP